VAANDHAQDGKPALFGMERDALAGAGQLLKGLLGHGRIISDLRAISFGHTAGSRRLRAFVPWGGLNLFGQS